MIVNHETNMDRAIAAWGEGMPEWVRQLATACDRTNQRVVAERLKAKHGVGSSGYVSRILNRNYLGSYDEAERLVRATFGAEIVDCPEWGAIPLSSCVRNRRWKAAAQNHLRRRCAVVCPTCPNNTDRPETTDA